MVTAVGVTFNSYPCRLTLSAAIAASCAVPVQMRRKGASAEGFFTDENGILITSEVY